MLYSTYERDIVVGHGVILEGWPFPSMVSPSLLGTSLQPLNTLLAAIQGSEHQPPTCKWRKLTDDELIEKSQAFLESVKNNSASHKRKVMGTALSKPKRKKLSTEIIDEESLGDE